VFSAPGCFLFTFFAELNRKNAMLRKGPPIFVMSVVMWIVTNHGEKRAGTLFRAAPFDLFVMSDVMCIVTFPCRNASDWYMKRLRDGRGRLLGFSPSSTCIRCNL